MQPVEGAIRNSLLPGIIGGGIVFSLIRTDSFTFFQQQKACAFFKLRIRL